MEKPVLVVLAAGMGSRYGGLKQIEPIGPNGEIIIDYSVYDAIQAGFEKIIFIIKKEIEDDFKQAIGNRLQSKIKVEYVFQELSQLPKGYSIPQDRVKPWGTAQAVLAVKPVVKGPFAVINADDYYGASAFKTIYQFLSELNEDTLYGMVGYRAENTVTENGTVTRGVCQADDASYLTDIVERMNIEKSGGGARYTEDEGKTWVELPQGTLVSMNFWGFTPSFLEACEKNFPAFLDENLADNPMKCEYLLPSEVDKLIKSGKARVNVMQSSDIWHGITYKEDKADVAEALKALHQQGKYPNSIV